MRRLLPIAVLCATLATTAAAQEISTDFEEFNPNTPLGGTIVVGDAPLTAVFRGDAFAGRIGVSDLYFSGLRAWMVASGGTGLIEFESGASQVELWGRALPTADGATVITAFDGFEQVIDTVELSPGDPFSMISFVGSIDHIEVVNLATGPNDWNGIDDFSFLPAAAPLPGDTNGDGLVNIDDLNNVRNNFGGMGLGDTDADDDVDIDDLNNVRNNFGAMQTAAVPEPGTFIAACFGLLIGVVSRRHGRN